MTEELTDQEKAEKNAVAWLVLTDDELIERSGSLGLPGALHWNANEKGAVKATRAHVKAARAAADANARLHASDEFVAGWITAYREDD